MLVDPVASGNPLRGLLRLATPLQEVSNRAQYLRGIVYIFNPTPRVRNRGEHYPGNHPHVAFRCDDAGHARTGSREHFKEASAGNGCDADVRLSGWRYMNDPFAYSLTQSGRGS